MQSHYYDMVTTNDILNFAFNNNVFTRKELIANLKGASKTCSSGSLSEQLNRLLKLGQLVRVDRGVYKLSANVRKEFSVMISKEMREIDQQIKNHFPFINYCLWTGSALTSYMLHVQNQSHIFIDIEREVAESCFNFLITDNNKRVFLMPTLTDFERYISAGDAIIIRPLISESPL